MQFGCMLRVFALGFFSFFRLCKYFHIVLFLHYVLLCLRGGWNTGSLLKPAESCLNLKGCLNKVFMLPALPHLFLVVSYTSL